MSTAASSPQPLRFRSLASGSSGNCTVVEGSGADGQGVFRALIDCGFNRRQLGLRLQRAGLAFEDIHAIFVTHEHSDHVGACFELARRGQIPVWSSYGTWIGAGRPDCGGMWRVARDGHPIEWGGLQALPFTVPHDAREPLQLRISQRDVHIALLTDLGHVTPHVLAHAAHCHALLLEFNHEPELLANSRYPAFLKRRIAGPHGHLSNEAAAQLLQQVQHPLLLQIVAGHLSQQNNCVQRVQDWMRRGVGELDTQLAVASQEEGCDWVCPSSLMAGREDCETVPARPAFAAMQAA